MTPQETKAAVLAECERLCPNHEIDYLEFHPSMFIQKNGNCWNIYMSQGWMTWVGPRKSVEKDAWQIAFRLLGLKEPQEKDENGLLPCPFCGGKAKIKEAYRADLEKVQYIVECKKCACGTCNHKRVLGGMETWNTRNGV